ncbi:ectoine hydroxylase [Rubinisphaera margarita]|uniref:ectoine hydroxylase n=1 Tax=Rubinisphaera margarita TaxID=2909586 RepID=UPI001EE87AC0|nr:ectoine hydroxylase [Rubinisphaera margarita]MCG6158302.1 ectoine hydroxylase [Rubinisphaera margarita]
MTATIYRTDDPYHSRTSSQWERVSRIDPIVSEGISGPLSPTEVDQYKRDGFLFESGLFSQNEVNELLTEARSLVANWPVNRSGIVKEPESETVRSIFRMHRYSRVFQQLFQDSRLLDRVRQLLGEDVYVLQSRVNYKPAFEGKEFYWHSDFETWHVEDGMPRMRAISVSLLLTESHEFNGPLMLIPGSHKDYIRCIGETPENHYESSLRRQEYGVPSAEALEEMIAENGIVAPKGPAGSVIFFECNTMHGSAGNLSSTPRNNVFAVYNAVSNGLVDPFCDCPPRPDYLAERKITPLKSNRD